mmetsp:Transcript_13823/g.34068  ORF Transcript_13823/g.34068 Transcript_13823/m.34068 type:complete len:795 (-) Transcript_13823:238-2622(-)|eukprot:CAMPEP_0178995442 /NCGR_PEP_ID=MMETSP0795-20121207/7830_1 /TAXON_ID=88552 /ORGANISM="Amoebophrya sp., Strain Ameob2" /LENGTH=794 /DNA_ID=CAMNT_0020687751 /DNA_START=183 /DNA_END=2567 /DNA_ORIENTATION=-
MPNELRSASRTPFATISLSNLAGDPVHVAVWTPYVLLVPAEQNDVYQLNPGKHSPQHHPSAGSSSHLPKRACVRLGDLKRLLYVQHGLPEDSILILTPDFEPLAVASGGERGGGPGVHSEEHHDRAAADDESDVEGELLARTAASVNKEESSETSGEDDDFLLPVREALTAEEEAWFAQNEVSVYVEDGAAGGGDQLNPSAWSLQSLQQRRQFCAQLSKAAKVGGKPKQADSFRPIARPLEDGGSSASADQKLQEWLEGNEAVAGGAGAPGDRSRGPRDDHILSGSEGDHPSSSDLEVSREPFRLLIKKLEFEKGRGTPLACVYSALQARAPATTTTALHDVVINGVPRTKRDHERERREFVYRQCAARMLYQLWDQLEIEQFEKLGPVLKDHVVAEMSEQYAMNTSVGGGRRTGATEIFTQTDPFLFRLFHYGKNINMGTTAGRRAAQQTNQIPIPHSSVKALACLRAALECKSTPPAMLNHVATWHGASLFMSVVQENPYMAFMFLKRRVRFVDGGSCVSGAAPSGGGAIALHPGGSKGTATDDDLNLTYGAGATTSDDDPFGRVVIANDAALLEGTEDPSRFWMTRIAPRARNIWYQDAAGGAPTIVTELKDLTEAEKSFVKSQIGPRAPRADPSAPPAGATVDSHQVNSSQSEYFLLSTKALNRHDKTGHTCLTQLTEEGIGLWIFEHRRDLSPVLLNNVASDGRTSFSRAATKGFSRLCRAIVEHENFDVDTCEVTYQKDIKSPIRRSGYQIARSKGMHDVCKRIDALAAARAAEHFSAQKSALLRETK